MLPYGVTRPQCVKFPHFTGSTWPPCQERHLPHWIQLCLTPSCSSQETRWAGMDCYWPGKLPGIILCIRPANERQRCNVTSSLIGWAYTQHDPWFTSNLASNILGLTLSVWEQINVVQRSKCHGCWCPVSCCQVISSHTCDIYCVDCRVSSFLIWGRISTTCVMSMWSNDIKCKYIYIFMFPLKNLAHKAFKGLIPCGTVPLLLGDLR